MMPWRDKVSPVITALSDELTRDYKVPAYPFPVSAAQTLAAPRERVDTRLPRLEDRARSSVARQVGRM